MTLKKTSQYELEGRVPAKVNKKMGWDAGFVVYLPETHLVFTNGLHVKMVNISN